MTFAGTKKCSTDSRTCGRDVVLAISSMSRPDVFDASKQDGLTTLSIRSNICFFNSRLSKDRLDHDVYVFKARQRDLRMDQKQFAAPPLPVRSGLFSPNPHPSCECCPWRARAPRLRYRSRRTGMPTLANAMAIPLPMVPLPITPALRISADWGAGRNTRNLRYRALRQECVDQSFCLIVREALPRQISRSRLHPSSKGKVAAASKASIMAWAAYRLRRV